MGTLRNFALLLALLSPPALANNIGAAPDPLLRDFAACAGRYSATLEHQWLMNTQGAEESAKRRKDFVSLIDALLPIAREDGLSPREVLNWRIEAKFAHAKLLQSGEFATDTARRGFAREAAARYLAQCNRMLLSG